MKAKFINESVRLSKFDMISDMVNKMSPYLDYEIEIEKLGIDYYDTPQEYQNEMTKISNVIGTDTYGFSFEYELEELNYNQIKNIYKQFIKNNIADFETIITTS